MMSTSSLAPVAPAENRSLNHMLYSHRTMDDFELVCPLGKGSYGFVHKARDRHTGDFVALKKFLPKKGRKKDEENQWREIEYMILCHGHPSIIKLKEVIRDLQDGQALVLVMELGGHSLWQLLNAWPGSFLESQVRSLMWQLLQGVKYLHENNIIHRDLKTLNILLSGAEGKLKICDFGLACQCSTGRQPHIKKVVTLWYRAPELLLEVVDYTAAIDMWSVGCIMAELLTKEPLFPGNSEEDQLDKITKVLGMPTEKTLPGLNDLQGISKLKLTSPIPKQKRNQLYLRFMREPKLSKLGLDLLKGLLMYDPEKRLTAATALCHPWFADGSSDPPVYHMDRS